MPTHCPWCHALFEPPAARAGTIATCAACTREFVTAGDTHVTILTRGGAAGPPPPPVALPREFTDRYLMDRVLGRGAMGMVVRAIERRSGGAVAVKFLVRAHDDAALARFVREAELLAQLDHPGIVGLLAASHVEGHPFLVMPYCGGGTLADRLADGPLPVGEVLRIATTLGAGLQACHEAGVVHRDLKPANVLFDDAGRARLSDLGVAKDYSGMGMTAVGAVVGTPAYMAPEQVRGEPAGTAADLYALGVLVFEMLTGRPPFEGPVREVFRQHRAVEPPPLEELVPGVEPSLAALVRRLLAKRVADRPGSAADALRMLERARAALPRDPAASHWVIVDGEGGVHPVGAHTLYLSAAAVYRYPGSTVGDPVLFVVVPDDPVPVIMHFRTTTGLELDGRALLRARLRDGLRIEVGQHSWTAELREGPEPGWVPAVAAPRPLEWARGAARLLGGSADRRRDVSKFLRTTEAAKVLGSIEYLQPDLEGQLWPFGGHLSSWREPVPGTVRRALMDEAWSAQREVMYPAGDSKFLEKIEPEPRLDLHPIVGCAFVPVRAGGAVRGLVYAEDARFRLAFGAREAMVPLRFAAGLIGLALWGMAR